MTAGYSGTPLPKKLGIAPGSRLLILGNPLGFDVAELEAPFDSAPVPAVAIDPSHSGAYDVVLMFCPDSIAMTTLFGAAQAAHTVSGSLWVCWLKKSSGISTDLGERTVREYGLANGRVDVKVVAIDAKWSGLKFVIRISDR